MTAPWALNLSTQVFNPSYVLMSSLLFFIGAIETYPFLTKNLIPLSLANFMMGFALFWAMPFHMSWVILIPYILVSFYYQYKTNGRRVLAPLAWFMGGAIVTGSFLVPTYFRYGLAGGTGGTNEVIRINPHNLLKHLNIVEGVLGRFLSFASFELPRFIGNNTAVRVAFVKTNPWLIPFVIFLLIVGILQPIALFILWFSKNPRQRDWRAIKFLTLGTVVLLYLSFVFSIKAPLSHTFYVTFPLSMLYSLYCWDKYLMKSCWRKFAATIIICGIIFHVGLAIHNYSQVSLYVDRNKISRAIKNNDYRLLDERRSGAQY